ncbi:hypothetical protein [Mycobacterium parmense]|uniref:Uncharacterized protein n=1 Tax=Mycobacterium parmense TaxID=185642 RepID=A0A7I7YUF4_9MYCO|nr:hypothetical protein [Mycobacterium parmense]MCV7351054.1 hypothetical protein [Mycobacterium parmense]ORW60627.1 hypothetical protein AWC20_06525 [Mycobacterium parmense]BBZ45506.1 hypothetical protein MPRM_27870 [Mycobacterium parmense]
MGDIDNMATPDGILELAAQRTGLTGIAPIRGSRGWRCSWTGSTAHPSSPRRAANACSTTPPTPYPFALNTYNLGQYDLTVEKLAPTFAEYLDTFDIELEGAP